MIRQDRSKPAGEWEKAAESDSRSSFSFEGMRLSMLATDFKPQSVHEY